MTEQANFKLSVKKYFTYNLKGGGVAKGRLTLHLIILMETERFVTFLFFYQGCPFSLSVQHFNYLFRRIFPQS